MSDPRLSRDLMSTARRFAGSCHEDGRKHTGCLAKSDSSATSCGRLNGTVHESILRNGISRIPAT